MTDRRPGQRRPGQPMTVADAMSFLAGDAKDKGFVDASLIYRLSAIRRLAMQIDESMARERRRRGDDAGSVSDVRTRRPVRLPAQSRPRSCALIGRTLDQQRQRPKQWPAPSQRYKGSIQRELRPSTQREDQLTMETKLEQIAVKAVNQLPKSVVREIRTPRSVGAGGWRPPPATRWASRNPRPYRDRNKKTPKNSCFPLVQFTRTGPLLIVGRSITDIIWRRANE
jgi:hypothetical protein